MSNIQFQFEIGKDYGRKGPIFYYTNLIQLVGYSFPEYGEIYVWGTYEARNNGPKTGYAIFYRQVRWPTNPEQWFGFNLSKHFQGNNIGKQCRRWLNWMLNNCPNYNSEIHGNIYQYPKKEKI